MCRFWHVKLAAAAPQFFSGIKNGVTYAVVVRNHKNGTEATWTRRLCEESVCVRQNVCGNRGGVCAVAEVLMKVVELVQKHCALAITSDLQVCTIALTEFKKEVITRMNI